MSAPAGIPKRAGIVEKIVVANAKEIAASKQEAEAIFGKDRVNDPKEMPGRKATSEFPFDCGDLNFGASGHLGAYPIK
jgi:hypothetical protein